MSHLSEISLLIASEISSIENRQRKRSDDAQKHFEHAIECLVKDLWLGTVIHPEYEVGIHRRSNWYSETPQYRDSNLTYKQAIAAYDGMVATDFIRVVRDGFFDRDTGRSDKESEKSSMRVIGRGLWKPCHSCHSCHELGGQGS